jgi:hypothetical protein
VLVVSPEESIPRVFRKLVVEGFLSAPIVVCNFPEFDSYVISVSLISLYPTRFTSFLQEGTRFIGFIDMMGHYTT